MTKTFPERVEKQARKVGVHESAIADVLARADAQGISAQLNSGEKPGKQIRAWIEQQRAFRPHWFGDKPAEKKDDPAADAKGKKNPWSEKNWNPKAQYDLTRAIGAKAAGEIAESAGSFLGANAPGQKRLTSRFQKV